MYNSTEHFENFRARLAEQAATYVAIGDSVTEGSMEYEVIDREFHELIAQKMEELVFGK